MTKTKHPLYKRWYNMHNRCNSPKYHSFSHYGGRGIRVCKRWGNFNLFVKDVGLPPFPKAELDRENSNKHYSPSNVRWVTKQKNQSNRRTYNKNNLPRGVRKINKKFLAQINISNINYYLGTFPTAQEAGEAFNKVFFNWNGFLPESGNSRFSNIKVR